MAEDVAELSPVIAEAVAGLTAPRKTLPPKLLYDEAGCALFGEITGLPEYYPTRTERALLPEVAAALARRVDPGGAVVEYGASDEGKAALLFAELDCSAYVPIDIAPAALAALARRMRRSHPAIAVHPVAADFLAPLELPAAVAGLTKLGFFPGSTIGNFDPDEAVGFLRRVRATLGAGAGLLIGVDLEKPADILIPAYDDAAGVTAAFNLNLLARLNREADADFDLALFRHRAVWNAAHSRIEMHLESRVRQSVRVGGHRIAFAAGETIHTENSYKYSILRFRALAARAGWRCAESWTDDAGLFSVHLLG